MNTTTTGYTKRLTLSRLLGGVRRLGVGLLAALIGFGGMALAPAGTVGAAEADGSDVSVVRHHGADRYATSLEVAEEVAADAGGSLEWAVLVSGERWTDAVVAAPMAGALGAPLLMTPPEELRADALAFLQRMGVSQALVVGPAAGGGAHGPGRGVGAGVLEALRSAGISTWREVGADRYGTAAEIARWVAAGVMGTRGPTAVIASGEVFADALVAGPFAARGVHPVLLTPPSGLHAEAEGYLRDYGVEHVVLMGGRAALSAAVEQAVVDLGIAVSRVAGATRYDTAAKAAELVQGEYHSTQAGVPCFANSTIGVARARVPYDSFSAAPLLGRLCAPLLLANPDRIPPDTVAYVDTARQQHNAVSLQVFGGDAAVSEAAINAYLAGDDDSGTPTGVLPAGTCGGAIDDKPRQLVPNPGVEDPAWSPDCSRLAYTQYDPDSYYSSLWIVRNDGSDARKLLGQQGFNLSSPAWSPDGTRIAYSRSGIDLNGDWLSHIWTVNVNSGRNHQITTGDVNDRSPAWSPGSERIAFTRSTGDPDRDRYTVVMKSDGSQLKALNTGGPSEYSPAWSPDGTRFAYVSGGSLIVSDTDGSNARRVFGGVAGAGLSWSPDGTRIAFTRDVDSPDVIVLADIDGTEEVILSGDTPRGLVILGFSTPRWSPDGQLLAFATHFNDGMSRIYVTGARGQRLPLPADCRPRGLENQVTAGFPLPDWAPSATGKLRVAVLFMDFPDAQAAHTTQEEAALGLAWAEEYLEAASYGSLDVEFVPHHVWLRAEQAHSAYLWGDDLYVSDHAVALADPEFDFSGIGAVMTVFPGTHFAGGGNAGGTASADGVTMPSSRINDTRRAGNVDHGSLWGYVAAHELAHNLGLLDMYDVDDSGFYGWPTPPSGQEWIGFGFGLMGFSGWFLADRSLMPEALTSDEMLAWSRWQLGWLRKHQVRCVTSGAATVALAPVERAGGAVAMAAVPVGPHRIIVIESRREFDSDRVSIDGVFVYVVETLVRTGRLPVTIPGDNGNRFSKQRPLLRAGESITVLGHTITVIADNGNTHTVSITRDN